MQNCVFISLDCSLTKIVALLKGKSFFAHFQTSLDTILFMYTFVRTCKGSLPNKITSVSQLNTQKATFYTLRSNQKLIEKLLPHLVLSC